MILPYLVDRFGRSRAALPEEKFGLMPEDCFKDLKYMKEKLENVEENGNWLERQLKASKKQNKLLRAELEIRLAGIGPSPNPESGGGLVGNRHRSASAQPFAFSARPGSRDSRRRRGRQRRW